jgi:hypothetical protein
MKWRVYRYRVEERDEKKVSLKGYSLNSKGGYQILSVLSRIVGLLLSRKRGPQKHRK